MAYLEPPDGDVDRSRHRAWHADVAAPAPDTYPVPPFPPPFVAVPGDELELNLDAGSDRRPVRTRQQRREAEQGPADGAKPSRAGRNLPAAIGVGIALGGVVIASLLWRRQAFLVVIGAASAVAVWEMIRAISQAGPTRSHPPLVPLLAACPLMIVLAWRGGVEAMILGLTLTVVAALIWRLADGPVGYLRDVGGAVLVAVYIPFLAGFAALLVHPADGTRRVLLTLASVVLSDTGGYVAGVFFGRHPMAPTVSPKKSWEGLAGSLLATAAGGSVLIVLMFHQPWWHGALFGLAVSAAAVLGDLAESLLKRDLGVKDMSHLLPGHGGLMDRLDSVLFAAPTAFVLLSLLAPAVS